MYWKRMAEILGLPSDPRDFVNEFEEAQDNLSQNEKQAAMTFLSDQLHHVNHHDPDGVVQQMYSDGL
jgi:hypothetical protein